jgi:hypothetical protein
MTTHLFDLSLGGIIYILILQGIFTLAVGVAAFLAITIVESVILRLLQWGDLWQSIRDSLLVNFVTTLLGFAMAFGVFGFFDAFYGMPYDPGEIIPAMLVLLAITIPIEGLMLGYMRRRSAKQAWTASLLINTCSYVLLTAATLAVPFPSLW